MRELLQVTRIRLMNFHNFTDEVLPVRKNLFLIGQNRSGKTTVLDAVHLALSAGVEMEFNAAARFGPKSDSGRNLASIILRYDLETDRVLRDPCVGYVILEVKDWEGLHHCFGVGAFATSLDSQPDLWGFLARRQTLEGLEMIVDEEAEGNPPRKRPRDRQELEDQLGRGNVLDKGRYRSALAQFLFKDRDGFERAMELLSAGKSYREMVAKSKSLDDLFLNLLPPPATAEFQEVHTALRAIEGIRVSLADLDSEIDVLRFVLEKLADARRETEKILRYEFIGAERSRQGLEKATQAAASDHQEAQDKSRKAAHAANEAEQTVSRLERSLIALRASEGTSLLAREEELRRDLDAAKRQSRVTGEARRIAAARLEDATRNEAEAAQAYAAKLTQAIHNLEEVTVRGAELLDGAGLRHLELVVRITRSLSPGSPLDRLELLSASRVLRQAFETVKTNALVESARQKEVADRLRSEERELRQAADEVKRRAEVLPEIKGYGELLGRLQELAPNAVPLYRLLQISNAFEGTVGSLVEGWLGPRVLGAIVAIGEDERRAREIVLSHGEGVEVLRSADFPATESEALHGTLAHVLEAVDAREPSRIGLRFVNRLCGDVALLEPHTPLGERARAVWSDGYLFDRGAEARVAPGPPVLLGADARRKAAQREVNRLLAEAQKTEKEAQLALDEAAKGDHVASKAIESADRLLDPTPDALLASLERAENLAAAAKAARTELGECGDREANAKVAMEACEARHAEVKEAISKHGLAALQARLQETEKALDSARREHTAAREGVASIEAQVRQKTSELDQKRQDSTKAADEAQRRREALLPLIEPKYRSDLQDYVFRIMRGHQVLAQNVPNLVQEANNARSRAFEALQSSDGLKNDRLWQKYAFRLTEETREIRDQNGRPVEEVFEGREAQVRELQKALDEKTRDLLERVVMAGLVRRLQGQIRDLQETIRGVNKLASDLRFGDSHFQFSLKQRPEYQRLLGLLREESILQPGSREELRDFFRARLEDLRRAPEGGIPEVLDYRRWFEFTLQVTSRPDGEMADLPRQRLRFGSTGEQAVPTHLLIISMAALLYDRIEARLRLLLLDEAFLGIDAVRREALLQFSDRVGVDLFVATPELDGVTPSLAASTTLLIEKTPKLDVFVSDYQWERGPQQISLGGLDKKASETYLIGSKAETKPAAPAKEVRH